MAKNFKKMASSMMAKGNTLSSGDDFTGASTWPRGLKNPAAGAMQSKEAMTPGQIIKGAKASGKKVPGMNWEDRTTYAPKGGPKMGPIGESVKDVTGKLYRGSQKVGNAMGKVIPAIGKGLGAAGKVAAVSVLGGKAVPAAREALGMKRKLKK